MQEQNLKKLLKLVKELSEKEDLSWFKDSLENHFSRYDKSYDFLRLLKKNFRIKGKKLYEFVSKEEKNFKEQLIKDYIEMNIFLVLGNYKRTLQFCCMQAENILNYYCHKSKCHEKIEKNPNKFFYKNKNWEVEPIEKFFIKKERVELEKVSLWAKYAFWVKDAKFKTEILGKDAFINLNTEQIKKHHFSFSMMVNVRNQESHRNTLKAAGKKKEFIKFIKNHLKSQKKEPITNFKQYDNLLYKMASSLEQIQV